MGGPGKIKFGGKASLSVDKRGRIHWRTPMQEKPATNREKLVAEIQKVGGEFVEDLKDRIDIFFEDPNALEEGETYDLADALMDRLDDAENAKNADWLNADEKKKARAYIRQCNKILFAAGFFRPVSDKDLAEMVVTRGRKTEGMIKRNGVWHEPVSSYSAWLEK